MKGHKHRKKRALNVLCAECGNGFVTGCGSKKHCSAQCRIRAIAKQFEGVDGCWIWPLSTNPVSGYGQLMHSEPFGPRKLHAAHVLSYETFVGPLNGLQSCHHCDVRACFNPAHLFAGTQKDNMQDMVRKGRANRVKGRVAWNLGLRGAYPSGDDHHLRRNGTACLPRGEQHKAAKLTEDAVREIRASSETLAALAKRFGVSNVAVNNVRLGRTWKHVT